MTAQSVQNHHTRKGFTLVELLVAISIVAVVSAIGYINYTTAQVSARDARRKHDLQAMKVGLELYYQAIKRYPCTDGNTNLGWVNSASLPPTSIPWVEINDYADTSFNCAINLASQVNFNKAFINVMPIDPLKNLGVRADKAGNYGYSYFGADVNNALSLSCGAAFRKGKYYILATQLENGSDPDAVGSSPANVLCGGTQPPPTGVGPKTYIVAPDYH